VQYAEWLARAQPPL